MILVVKLLKPEAQRFDGLKGRIARVQRHFAFGGKSGMGSISRPITSGFCATSNLLSKVSRLLFLSS
jgi:hypothetical protein